MWVEYFDQSADCTINSPTGDKLYPRYIVTSLPNRGARTYDDCDGPLTNVQEELELEVDSWSIGAEFSHHYNVAWRCNNPAVSGEVNTTFELGLSAVKDWLAKSYYGLTSCQGPFVHPTSISMDYPVALQQPSTTTDRTDPVVTTQVDDSGLYEFQVLRTFDGDLKARVHVDFSHERVLSRYLRLNSSIASSLERANTPTLVTLTFKSPITTDQAELLVNNVGMKVSGYGIFGKDDAGTVISIYSWPEEGDTRIIQVPSDINHVQIDGVLTITGVINSNQLETLNNDIRIFLIDVTANRVRDQVETLVGEPIELRQIGVSNPAWLIAAGKLKPQ